MPKTAAPNLFIADDTELVRNVICRALADGGLFSTAFASGDALLAALHPDVLVCLLDLRMPGRSGLECLHEIKKLTPHTEVIFLTGVNEAREAVAALKSGAFDYLTKPFAAADLVRTVNKAMQLSRAARDNQEIRHSFSTAGPEVAMLGRSPAMEHIKEQIHRLRSSLETILLTGESGTGKTLAARALHSTSSRAAAPFISVSCPSMPRDLLESEMFGHEKGAFSGAIQRRLGRVELAHGGTLFLDEVGDLPLELQPKLLTFLQDRTFFRVGGETAHKADVRIIAATHQDLAKLCREGRFREDLYYRLAVVPIETPPLRARLADLPDIAQNFLQKYAQRNRRPAIALSSAALDVFLAHDWPGNIRELENLLARTAAFLGDKNLIEPTDLPATALTRGTRPLLSTPGAPPPREVERLSLAGLTLREIEDLALDQTLAACGQSRARAARLLGLSEKTIYNLLRRRTERAADSSFAHVA